MIVYQPVYNVLKIYLSAFFASSTSPHMWLAEVLYVSDVLEISEVSEVSEISEVSEVSEVSQAPEVSEISEVSMVSEISEGLNRIFTLGHKDFSRYWLKMVFQKTLGSGH